MRLKVLSGAIVLSLLAGCTSSSGDDSGQAPAQAVLRKSSLTSSKEASETDTYWPADCSFNGINIWGRIWVVSNPALADIRVWVVSNPALADIRVYVVSNPALANSCGSWYLVSNPALADIRIYSTSNPALAVS